MIKQVPLKLARCHLYCDICGQEMTIKVPIEHVHAYCGITPCKTIEGYTYKCINGHSLESIQSFPYDITIEE